MGSFGGWGGKEACKKQRLNSEEEYMESKAEATAREAKSGDRQSPAAPEVHHPSPTPPAPRPEP